MIEHLAEHADTVGPARGRAVRRPVGQTALPFGSSRRGIMAPKGTPDSVITILAEKMPAMFNDKKVVAKMQEGGSPMRVMSREQVQAMWKERQTYLAELLKDLRKE